ncbi:MAG TPA: hypothetical protein PKA55_07175 [Rhodoblastus sp.]|nr:hypothetical protein [Rhodoblastus sp.]
MKPWPPTRRLVAAAALLCVAAPARAQMAVNHFGYCAPPTPPSCVNAVMDAGEKKLKACEQDVERYVASVFAYRGCIAAETERAVREANATIRKMRCARDPGFCPQAPEEVEPEAEKPKAKKTAK